MPKLELSISKIFLYMLIPGGPFYARVKDFNGSVDHSWLFIPVFNLFPLSIIPVMMMAFGKIKKGKGVKPYDNWMWLPIISRLIVAILCSYFITNPIIKTVTVLLLSIISILIPGLIKRNNQCKTVKDDKDKLSFSFDGKQIYKCVIDAVFLLSIGEFFIILVKYIPYIGGLFRILSELPVVGKVVSDIIWILCFINFYIMVNMFNQENMGELCYPTKYNYPNDITKLTFGLVFMIVYIAYSIFTQVKGGGKGSSLRVQDYKKQFSNTKGFKQSLNSFSNILKQEEQFNPNLSLTNIKKQIMQQRKR